MQLSLPCFHNCFPSVSLIAGVFRIHIVQPTHRCRRGRPRRAGGGSPSAQKATSPPLRHRRPPPRRHPRPLQHPPRPIGSLRPPLDAASPFMPMEPLPHHRPPVRPAIRRGSPRPRPPSCTYTPPGTRSSWAWRRRIARRRGFITGPAAVGRGSCGRSSPSPPKVLTCISP